jgi:hypothetical protein
VPNPATVTVKAVSVQDPTKSGTASVTIAPPPNPAPMLSGISPRAVRPGYGKDFTLTASGANFVPGATVQVNG